MQNDYTHTLKCKLSIVGCYTEPEIAVGHWPFSDQFQDLAEQK